MTAPLIAIGNTLNGNLQGTISGITWTASAGSISSSGLVTCPSTAGSVTIRAHKSGYADGLLVVPVNSTSLTLQRVTPAISTYVDCIGGGNGANGTASVTFKVLAGGTDVTNSATWTGTGDDITADPTTKGRLNCGFPNDPNQQQQVSTGTFMVQYNGATATGLLKVEGCDAVNQNNCVPGVGQ
jgi:hypothetical protein